MLPLTTIWMELEVILLNKIAQAQEYKYLRSYKSLQMLRVQWRLPEATERISEGGLERLISG